jgi:NRPS condensation-like uncharacterized protein
MPTTAPEYEWAQRTYRVEAFDLWSYHTTQFIKPYIRIRIDFCDKLDEAVLRQALILSCTTIPLIACSLDTSSAILFSKPRWQPNAQLAQELLRVVTAHGDGEEEIYQALTETIDMQRGPQLHVTLVRRAESDSLCLLINHMICDAAGYKQYLRELARLYSALAAGEVPSPRPDWHNREIEILFKTLTRVEQRKVVRGFPRMGPRHEMWSHQHKEELRADKPIHMLRRVFDKDVFDKARAKAKALGFTVNDLFGAAYARAWHRITGEDEVVLPCTMDMRAFLPPEQHIGIANYSAKCPCLVTFSPNQSMEDVLAQFSARMRVYKEERLAIGSLIRWATFSRWVPFRRMEAIVWKVIPSPRVSFSNMAIIDEDCVRFGEVPVAYAVLSMVASSLPFHTVSFSTFRGVPTASCNIMGDDKHLALEESILSALVEEVELFARA